MRATFGAASLSGLLRSSPMARYFFHVRRGQITILDQDGVELVDLREAIKEAARRVVLIEASEAAKHMTPMVRSLSMMIPPCSRCR